MLRFSFHYIAFDGKTLGTIRSLLTEGWDENSTTMMSFRDLNAKARCHSSALHDISADEILAYAIAKPRSAHEEIAQDYQAYDSFRSE